MYFLKLGPRFIKKWIKVCRVRDDRIDNLCISRDFDEDPDKDAYVVMLYTPDMKDTNHHHHIRAGTSTPHPCATPSTRRT